MELKTREDWLLVAMEQLLPLVEKHGKIPDAMHIICSWPPRSIRKIIGVCYGTEWTSDGSVYITVSPVLNNPRHVLHTILHELVHAVGVKSHGKKFQAICAKVGLLNEAPTVSLADAVRSPELELLFTEMIQELGDYPHVAMTPPESKKKEDDGEEKKKPYVKLFDPDLPEYWIYMPIRVFEKYGAPVCRGASNKLMEVLKDDE